MDDFERELKIGFLEEASQAVSDVEQCFLALETDPNNTENLNKIFRLAHNLKGSSKAVGFDQFGAFTHEFETFILKIKNGVLPASPSVINLLLRSNDFILNMIEGLKENLDAQFNTEALLNELTNFQESDSEKPATSASETDDQVHADDTSSSLDLSSSEDEVTNWDLVQEINQNLEKSDSLKSLSSVIELVRDTSIKEMDIPQSSESPIVSVVSQISSISKESPNANATNSASSGSIAKATVDESIRVSLSKVEALLNFVGEMVILQSVLREQLTDQSPMLMRRTVHQMGKVGKEIQDLSMSLRMVPVKTTFQKMQRIVRDTAQVLGKDVGIQLVGEETEIDKTVLERINDPLVHLVRNSVDHGIESADQRLACGKPAKGQVILKSYHQSGKLVIEVTDDGGGLNAEKLKRKALEKGIIKPGVTLTEMESYQLIFAPGFSTKDQVSEVSGRGVGMDVVRTNIKELGGEIQIFSELGKGTTFRIDLPLTLAIIDAMVVCYGKDRFVMPLNHVFETLQPKQEMLQSTTNMGNVLLLRGENLPLYRLGDFFNLKSESSATNMIAMVVRTAAKPFALLVDDIIGQYQVVVKQLGKELQSFVGVSGSTILGDGRPCLILEPVDLIKRKQSLQTPLNNGGKAA